MIPIHQLKLGKNKPKHDPRTLCMAKYMQALPPPPASVDWSKKVGPLGMMLNDKIGNCTIAGAAHLVQAWTGNANGTPVILADSDVLLGYEAACGYNPAFPRTDQGGVEIDVLNYWRKNGIGPAGHQIAAYGAVNVLDHTEVMTALNLFGGLYTGVALPVSAQSQVGTVWDVVNRPSGAPGSWGGHCVPIVAADHETLTCITWGAFQKMTWKFWNRYFDEAYACLTPDWIAADGKSPSGVDLATLQSDLAQIALV